MKTVAELVEYRRIYQQKHKIRIAKGKRIYQQKHNEEHIKYSCIYRRTIKGHLQQIYGDMIQRCINPNHRAYKWYGGRGIKVCFKSLDSFRSYVINELQIDPRSLTIDRINNDGNYERGNIRFVTQIDNLKNRRSYKKRVR